MAGHACPGCGTPRGADGGAGSGCDCAERAADAVRAERKAEIAAAEDFDPLRIRPYVTLERPHGEEGRHGEEAPEGSGTEPEAATAPLPLPLPLPVLAPRPRPRTEPTARLSVDPDPVPQHRRRPLAGLMVGAAALAMAGTAAFAGGLFSGDEERNTALPDTETSAPGVSAAVPDAPSSSPTRSVSPSASAAPSRTPSASHSSPRTAPEPSGRPERPSTPPASTARATGTVSQPAPEPPAPATLRRGDSGLEVVELQKRLAEAWMYGGQADGQYSDSVEEAVRVFQRDRDVKSDPEGVYGPDTRRALEAETREP
ncbi:peptidoglycan-binding protein [Streptomyces sp. NPDC048479]|uniref:peptidoglycan-binding domain-containing protein n=1 Tax=Streptomyces sp. NPDC048479 TaxID=3154725 RepID=UPI00342EEF13